MALFSMSGTTIEIGGTLASKQTDFDASDFSGVSWTTIGGVGSIGAIGDQANFGSYNILGTRRAIPFLTTLGGGTAAIEMAKDEEDSGQAALRTAGENPGSFYAFRVTFDNAEGGTAGNIMFIAQVSPLSYNMGGNDDPLLWTASLAVQSNIVETDRIPA